MVELVAVGTEDWPRAWAMQREAFEDLVTATYGGWTGEQVQRCVRAWDVATTRWIVVAGRAVGWVRVEHRDDHDWLDLIVVQHGDRGRGAGAAAMRRLMSDAAARGVPLWLSVYRANPARRLYERLGLQASERDDVRVFMGWPSAPWRIASVCYDGKCTR